MSERIKRMKAELEELCVKINGATLFIISKPFSELESYDQDLLREQVKHMIDYRVILGRRIERAVASLSHR